MLGGPPHGLCGAPGRYKRRGRSHLLGFWRGRSRLLVSGTHSLWLVLSLVTLVGMCSPLLLPNNVESSVSSRDERRFHVNACVK